MRNLFFMALLCSISMSAEVNKSVVKRIQNAKEITRMVIKTPNGYSEFYNLKTGYISFSGDTMKVKTQFTNKTYVVKKVLTLKTK